MLLQRTWKQQDNPLPKVLDVGMLLQGEIWVKDLESLCTVNFWAQAPRCDSKSCFIGSVKDQKKSWSWDFGEEFGNLGDLTTVIFFGRKQRNLFIENIFGVLFLIG